MTGNPQRWIGAVAIAGLGIATGWLQPDYAAAIMVIGSFFILCVMALP